MNAPNLARRRLVGGLAGILAAGVAPAFIDSRILMPLRTERRGALIVTCKVIVAGGQTPGQVAEQVSANWPRILRTLETRPLEGLAALAEWRHADGGQVLIRAL